jgi:hypothetical protein
MNPPPPPNSRPHDAQLSKALWLSAGIWLVLAIVCMAAYGWLKHEYSGRSAPLATPATPNDHAAEAPAVRFVDITASSGVAFVQRNGAYGEKLLPETMGGGVAFFDFDGDGDSDLLFINGMEWPWRPAATGAPATMALYRNDGHGRFDDVTAGSGLDISFYGMGCATGDYDNDGLVDVVLTGVGGNRLFHNAGQGRFTEVTVSSGIGGSTNDWSTSAAWIDYDNDGDLDLFVCHYVRWSRELDLKVGYTFDGKTRAYGPPMRFEGSFPSLYRNDGGGRFTDVSASSGLQVRDPTTGQPVAKSLAVAPVDVDDDGWIDLIVANDTVQNFLFHNLRDGRFAEIGSHSGIAFDAYGSARGAMGIDAARFRNDGALGIAIGNFANEMNALYVSQRDALRFADEAVTEGMGPASRQLLKFGLFFFDYDLDGRLDVLTANGHLDEAIAQYQPNQRYRQPAQLFWNRGSTRGMNFVAVPEANCGADLMRPLVGRGSAFSDIDGDGDLDVVMTQIAGPPLLLRNDQTLSRHWLRFKLVGTKCNRDAIGAWIKVRAGGQRLSRQVMPTRSYLSQSELPVTIGLGSATQVEEVEVQWPGGRRQKVTGAKLDMLMVVRQE